MPESNPELVALAKSALIEITPEKTIGDPIAVVEENGVSTVTFSNRMDGYPGWQWTVAIGQVEGEQPTVLETELMPGLGSLLAPDWVPWSERLADYQAAQEAAAAEGSDDDSEDSDDDDDDLLGSDVLHGGDLDGVDIDEDHEHDDDSDESDDSDDDDDDESDDDESDDDDEDDADDDEDEDSDDSDDDDSDEDDDSDDDEDGNERSY